jgi:ABC-type multidrug transport system ATPase subunit
MLKSTMPQIFMISGPNGAGKTTASMDLLPKKA